MMQHDREHFRKDVIEIRDEVFIRSEKARSRERLRISHLSMASRLVTRAMAEELGMKPSWFCLRVNAHCESSVEKLLLDADVECLVVRSKPYSVVRRGRIRNVPAMPVVRGYVLVRCLKIAQALHGLVSLKNVIDIVGGIMGPYRVADKHVNQFKEFADEGRYDRKEPALHSFMVDQEVRVTDGPFASFPGTITAIDGKHMRVDVEVSIFGRPTPVNLDLAQIEKL